MRVAGICACMLALCVVVAGCVHTGRGTATFSALQSAVESAADSVGDSVVLVGLTRKAGGESNRMMVMMGRRGRSGRQAQAQVNGIVLTEEGHVLIAGNQDPDTVSRVEVWIGDEKYPAKIIKADENLGMTIVKVNSDDALVPLDLNNSIDLSRGAWCVVIEAAGETMDFQKFATIATCRGEVEDMYRQFILDRSLRSEGALVVSIDGRPAGLLRSGRAVSMKDLSPDIEEFLAETTGDDEEDKEEEENKTWLGAMLQSINEDYARANDLPREGIWITHVLDDSPALAAGIENGDLVVGVNGRRLRLRGARGMVFFQKALRRKEGRPFTVTVLRDGEEIECGGTFTKRPEPETFRADDLGVTVKNITDADYIGMNLFTMDGVLVTELRPGSPAATSATFGRPLLQRGDVITGIGDTLTPTLKKFAGAIEKIRRGRADVLLVTYRRGLTTGYAGLNMKMSEESGEESQ